MVSNDTQRLAMIMLPVARAIHSPEAIRRMKSVDQAIGHDGHATDHLASGVLGHQVAPWFVSGTLAVGNTQGMQYRVGSDGRIERFDAIVKTAPTGADLKVRLRQNGHTLVTLIVPAGSTSAGVGVNQAVSAGDVLTIDIAQVGSSTAGANLSATATMSEGRPS